MNARMRNSLSPSRSPSSRSRRRRCDRSSRGARDARTLPRSPRERRDERDARDRVDRSSPTPVPSPAVVVVVVVEPPPTDRRAYVHTCIRSYVLHRFMSCIVWGTRPSSARHEMLARCKARVPGRVVPYWTRNTSHPRRVGKRRGPRAGRPRRDPDASRASPSIETIDRSRPPIDRDHRSIETTDRSRPPIDRSVWMRHWCARDARACGGDDDRARVVDESRVRGRGDDGAGGDADGDVFDRARGERTETRGDWIRR